MRSVIARIVDARDHARQAAELVRDISFIEFAAEVTTRQAVCFCLVILGEACSEAAKSLAPLPLEVPWAEIKGMRNILVREYWQIDDAIVYNIARNEATALADQLDRLLRSPSGLLE